MIKAIENATTDVIRGPAIKLCCFDIDGTLVYGTGQFPPSVLAELDRIRARGIAVCLATGRSFFGARLVAERLGIDDPSMVFSGSLIVTPVSGRTVWRELLEGERVSALIEALRKREFYTELYSKEEYFVESESEFTEIHIPYLNQAPVKMEFDSLVAREELYKIVVMVRIGEHEQRLRSLMREFPEFPIGVSIGAAHPDILYFNITPASASRERAFEILLRHYQVTPEEVAAFGDAEADIPFLRLARYGVAMSNAPEMVQDAARYITGTAEEGGVARALRVLVP